MSAYTPGPWKAEGPRVYADRKGGSLIATMAWFPGEEAANARLIAAAPELLEALRVLVENGGIGPESMFDDARAAIAKATGGQT